MYKRSLISFATLFIFWIAISGVVDLQHILVGVFVSSFTVWFWKDFDSRLPTILSPRELLLFAHCTIILIGYVIKSNINVIKLLLFSDVSSGSIFLELEPNLRSDWGRVFLATCITITPGTIAIDFDPETNVFAIHALTRETGIDLYYWQIITKIQNLEILVRRRRRINANNNDRIHASNATSSMESHNRSNRD